MGSNMTKRFKIEPDFTCPELAGYKLPPIERRQEDDVEAMAKEEFNNIDNPIRSGIDNHSYKTGFAEGYTKAREKFEFTEEEVRHIILKSFLLGVDRGNYSKEIEDNLLQYLRTTRTPIAIEVDMVESPAYNAIRMIDNSGCFVYCIPSKNPDGTVKGRYIYE
jgi:hypothetical protein